MTVGEQLSERQALDALLVGSANNIAGGLASWDAGSSSTFVAKMNATARALGLSTATRYTDPSGFDSATVSTAADQVRLAAAAFSDETFQEIVGQMQVALPVAGVVRNFDRLVGEGGIVGIKTGSTRAAGGCFVAAVREPVAGRSVVAFAAVLGQQGPNLINAGLDAGARLARAAAGSVVDEVLVPASTELGRLRAPWGATEPLETRADLRVLTIPGTSVDIVPSLDGRSVHAIPHTGATGAAGPPVALAGRGRLRPPSVWWRLTHS